MAYVRAVALILAISPALVLATARCELVMDDLPSARSPAPRLDAATDLAESAPESGTESESEPEPEPDSPDDTAAEPEPPESAPEADGEFNECDQDEDSHQAEVTCGGDDCDDNDSNVWTKEPIYFDTPSLHRDFDYDCSKTLDPDPAWNKQINCGILSLVLCNDKVQGYLGIPPACGQPGQWAKCAKNGALCEAHVLNSAKKLPCK